MNKVNNLLFCENITGVIPKASTMQFNAWILSVSQERRVLFKMVLDLNCKDIANKHTKMYNCLSIHHHHGKYQILVPIHVKRKSFYKNNELEMKIISIILLSIHNVAIIFQQEFPLKSFLTLKTCGCFSCRLFLHHYHGCFLRRMVVVVMLVGV